MMFGKVAEKLYRSILLHILQAPRYLNRFKQSARTHTHTHTLTSHTYTTSNNINNNKNASLVLRLRMRMYIYSLIETK